MKTRYEERGGDEWMIENLKKIIKREEAQAKAEKTSMLLPTLYTLVFITGIVALCLL